MSDTVFTPTTEEERRKSVVDGYQRSYLLTHYPQVGEGGQAKAAKKAASDAELAATRDQLLGILNTSDDSEPLPQMPGEASDLFRSAVNAGADPSAASRRINTAYLLADLQGVDFAEAYNNQDQILSDFYGPQLSPDSWADAVATTWKSAWVGTRLAKLAYQLGQKGGNDPDLLAQIYQTELDLPADDVVARSLPTKLLKDAVQFLPSQIESLKGGGFGAATGAGVASLGGLLFGAESIPTLAKIGARIGGGAGMAAASNELEAGSMYYDLLKYRDPVSGDRVNPAIAWAWAQRYGAIAAATELIPAEAFLKTIPGLGDAAKAVVKKEATIAAKSEAAALALRAFSKFMQVAKSDIGEGALSVGSEALQEAFQQAEQEYATETAKRLTNELEGTNLSPALRKDIEGRIADTFGNAFLGMIGLQGIPGTAKLFVKGGQTAAKTAQAVQTIKSEEQAAPEPVAVDAAAFAKRAAEPLPAGTVIQRGEEIEGEQYILKAGNKDTGERSGFVRYELDPEAQTARILGFEKAEPNVQAFLVRGLAARLPGWSIEMEPKTASQTALRDYLISQNPRGPEAGLQYYEAPAAAPQARTVAYIEERFREARPELRPEVGKAAANTIVMWSRRAGVNPDEFAQWMNPQVLGTVYDKSAAAAQGGHIPAGAYSPFQRLVDMAPTANESTSIHEFTHAFIDFAQATRGQNGQMGQFLGELEAAMGIEGGDWNAEFTGWTEEYHGKATGPARSYKEALTYAMEDYLAFGKAPKPELESLFRRFVQWIMDIYEGLKGARVKMSPEMTSYFDKLFSDSPFAEERQTVSEGEIGVRERELDLAPADAMAGQGEAPEANLDERRRLAGSRRDLAAAKERVAAGEDAETVARETGWREQNGEWRQDREFRSEPEYETDEREKAVQEGRPAEGAPEPLGPATFTEKAYPAEDEQLYQGEVLYSGEWGMRHDQPEGSGQEGVEYLLRKRHGWVEHAFYRPEIGWIDIPYGETGTIERDYEDGYGLAKILEKHETKDQVLAKLEQIIKYGRISRDREHPNPPGVHFDLGQYQATVKAERPNGKPGAWLLTAYIPEVRRRTLAADGQKTDPRAYSPRPPSQPKGTSGLVAGTPATLPGDVPPGAPGRTPPVGKRKLIVRSKPAPGKSLDQNDIKPPKEGGGAMFQGETGSALSSKQISDLAQLAEYGLDGDYKDLGPEAQKVFEDAGVDYLDGYHVVNYHHQRWWLYVLGPLKEAIISRFIFFAFFILFLVFYIAANFLFIHPYRCNAVSPTPEMISPVWFRL